MFGQQPFRLTPAGPAAAYKTYSILAPAATHFRVASCAEVECAAQARGWTTVVDESTPLGQRQAYYIRSRSGRAFVESKTPAGWTEFVFTAGQTCFAEHKVSLERPEFYVVRGGDWRGNPVGDRRLHDRPEHWVEDFALHQDRVATVVQRG